ncbi:putative glycosidase crf1-like protein 2 [Colletotrichum chlorophyti]|uniref:Putative glycosidase crf1-like protein 2 n=1 Tax=Colletotrichum chlorophyti TaxID=708187 RepID=A0A1Q8S3X5_9PEZI|nr:putative glycosidase crf1-like protein 2 [Colletotrichum chlorophyti]
MMKIAALTLAAAGLASAQTWSLCNPVKGEVCPPNPAFGGDTTFDFRASKNIKDLESFFTIDDGIKYNSKVVKFSGDTGAEMIIFEEDNAPTLTSKNYLFFGKVEVELQAAPGRGIVTSIVLQSDALDEIDWEFVGADQAHVQSNFYALGVNDYTHGRYHEVPFNPMTSIHTYTIEWTKESMVFSIDGKVYRTATPAEGSYPQTPMQLKLGTWVGGKGKAQGTIDWAGGLAQWENAPFSAYYRSLKVWDYAGGDKAGAKSYEYSKGSDGKWQSINILGVGEKNTNSGVGSGNSKDEKDDDKASHSGSATLGTSKTGSATQAVSGSSRPAATSVSSVSTAANITSQARNSTTLTTQAPSSASATGAANAQTTLPTTTGGSASQTSQPAEAAAPALQGGLRAAVLAAFFATLML